MYRCERIIIAFEKKKDRSHQKKKLKTDSNAAIRIRCIFYNVALSRDIMYVLARVPSVRDRSQVRGAVN